jgi:SAM-dependent methyltransferase
MLDLPYTGERAVPWNFRTGTHIMQRHTMRYAWAMQFCGGKRVVDVGCGCGYGSAMLSWVATRVLGIDSAMNALTFALSHFHGPNLRFDRVNLKVMSLPPAQVYVAFEILEHLDEPEKVIDQIDGTLIWSLPVNDGSRYHKRAYSVEQAEMLAGGNANIWYQGPDGTIIIKGMEPPPFASVNVLGRAHIVKSEWTDMKCDSFAQQGGR